MSYFVTTCLALAYTSTRFNSYYILLVTWCNSPFFLSFKPPLRVPRVRRSVVSLSILKYSKWFELSERFRILSERCLAGVHWLLPPLPSTTFSRIFLRKSRDWATDIRSANDLRWVFASLDQDWLLIPHQCNSCTCMFASSFIVGIEIPPSFANSQNTYYKGGHCGDPIDNLADYNNKKTRPGEEASDNISSTNTSGPIDNQNTSINRMTSTSVPSYSFPRTSRSTRTSHGLRESSRSLSPAKPTPISTTIPTTTLTATPSITSRLGLWT